MEDSYIKKSIDEVKQYLAEKQSVDELLGQTDKVKSIIMGSDYWNGREKIIKQVLRYNVCINQENIVEKGEFGVGGIYKYGDKVVGCKYSIQGGSVIADLCNAFQVDIPQDLQTKFGPKLNFQSEKSSDSADDYNKILSNLQQTLKKTISKTLNIDVNTKLSDDQIYQIVSRLPDHKEESKKLLLKSYRKTNGVENPDIKLEQPAPNLFNLLGDEKLETYINEYRNKSLEERKKDPLRQVFRWNENTGKCKLENMTQNKTIQQWFTGSMSQTAREHRDDIYFVLLELFGKDFEFGGYQYENDGETKTVPKFKLWDKVNKKAVKDWYKEKKIHTDLFDDLQIEEEEKIVITEKQNDNNINATAKGNKSLMKGKNSNMDISKKNKEKNGTEKKQSETSKTGYKIGLGLDILVTAIFAILAIKISLLFLISLAVTVPIGIYCGIELCGCCLSSVNGKIETSGQYFSDEPEESIAGDKNQNRPVTIDGNSENKSEYEQ